MIRLLLVIATTSFLLSSCLSGGSQATILKTDEKTLLGNTKDAPISSPDTVSSMKTELPPATPAGGDTDTSSSASDISPESDVVTPIGSVESVGKPGIRSE